MKLLHIGFDTLHVAIQGAVSASVVEKMEAAKERACEAGEPEFEQFSELEGHIETTGASGGYRFKFNQGPLKAKWLIKRNRDPRQWNLFCQIGSQALAEKGVVQCIAEMWDDLDQMDAKVTGHAVNRWDVCADVKSKGFEILRSNIVCHSMATVATHEDDFHLSIHSGGGVIDTITVGKMPSRQIQIYNKRKEHKRSGKSHWWDIWGIKDDKTPIWRVELRFGKLHNSDWNIRTLDDLAAMGGDVVKQAMDDVRYVEERHLTNVSRSKVHSLWNFVKSNMVVLLETATCGARRGKIREVIREDLKKCTEAQSFGVGLTAMILGLPEHEKLRSELGWEEFKRRGVNYMTRVFERHFPEKEKDFDKKVSRIDRRYHFLDGELYA